MNDEYLYEFVVSLVDHAPYRMLDVTERESIIAVAYTEALLTYDIGTEHFVDYALRYIHNKLDNAKYLYYRQCRIESPAPYEEVCCMLLHPMNVEESAVFTDFLSRLPHMLRVVAVCYSCSMTKEDICESLCISNSDIRRIDRELRFHWNRYNQAENKY